MRCTNCGNDAREGARFCGICGRPLDAAGRPPSPGPPEARTVPASPGGPVAPAPPPRRRWRGRRVALAGVLVAVLAGGGIAFAALRSTSGSPSPRTTISGPGPAQPSTPTTTPSVSTGASTVSLSTMTCPSNVARGELPPTIEVPLPSGTSPDLAAYGTPNSSTFGTGLLVVAPAGWNCSDHIFTGDGGELLSAYPPDEPPSTPEETPAGDAVSLFYPGGAGLEAGVACPFFPQDPVCGTLGSPSPLPPSEQVERPSPGVVTFFDPAGIKGSGDPSGGTDPSFGAVTDVTETIAKETCVLPASEAAPRLSHPPSPSGWTPWRPRAGPPPRHQRLRHLVLPHRRAP
jgi:hypothetical protein